MSVEELIAFFRTLKLSAKQAQIASRLIREIGSRLEFLHSVGIGYLSLSRAACSMTWASSTGNTARSAICPEARASG